MCVCVCTDRGLSETWKWDYRVILLANLSPRGNTLKIPVTASQAERWLPGSAWAWQTWLGSVPGLVLGCYVPLEALPRGSPATSQKRAKSGTDLLAASAEGSYWSMPSSQEVTGSGEESKTRHPMLCTLEIWLGNSASRLWKSGNNDSIFSGSNFWAFRL